MIRQMDVYNQEELMIVASWLFEEWWEDYASMGLGRISDVAEELKTRYSKDPGFILVAELGCQVVGVVILAFDDDPTGVRLKCQWLSSLYVHPDYRNQGVATALIKRFLNKTQGTVFLWCDTNMMEFYKKFGFVLHDTLTLRGRLYFVMTLYSER